MCMNISPNVLDRLKLLRFTGIDVSFFFNQIALYHGVTQGDKSCFRNQRHHGTGNLKKDLFLGHL